MRVNMHRLVVSIVLGASLLVRAQYHAELAVNPNWTEVHVAFTTGQVSGEYLMYLVNTGTNTESIEHGVDSASPGTTWQLDSIANPVLNGNYTRTTVTVSGTGGLFPYWINYWAQIVGAPETRQVKRLTIDTLATSKVRIAGHADRSATNRRAPMVHISATAGPCARDGVSLAGRATPGQAGKARAVRVPRIVASPR